MNWVKCLPLVLWQCRTRPQARTGLSAFEIVFGRPPNTGVGPPDWDTNLINESLLQYCVSLHKSLSHVSKQVKAVLPEVTDTPLHTHQPGDWVLIKDFRRKRWNQPRWRGPFQVLCKGNIVCAMALVTATTAKPNQSCLVCHPFQVPWTPIPITHDMATQMTNKTTCELNRLTGQLYNLSREIISSMKIPGWAGNWKKTGKNYEFQWSGCCTPVLLTPPVSIFKLRGAHAHTIHKRGTGKQHPAKYNGYTLADPWTTPASAIAWQVLTLANRTETIFTLLNQELHQIRQVVLQNRMALDLLLAEERGVCKKINVSCCFHIPDYYDNITDLITHMKQDIQEPSPADNSWFSWFTSALGPWGHWAMTVLFPVLIVVLMVMCFLPCIMNCCVTWVSGDTYLGQPI
uniref:Murine leukemia virus integrase C-terminal domain-containing protein n=1 Tax=Electrophorus electricus TaxID=8005 RepID=A0AAY5F054_ELEEL